MDVTSGFSLGPTGWSAFRAFVPLRKKLDWRLKKKAKIGDLGKHFNKLNTLPYILVLLVHVLTFLFFLMFLGYKANLFETSSPGILKSFFEFTDEHIFVIYILYGIFSVVDFFDLIPRIFVWGGSIIGLKNSMGWANASRHLELKEHANAICLCSEDHLRAETNKLIASIIEAPDNPNRAVRPIGLENEIAANILFIGHIIEGSLYSQNKYPSETLWTRFYEEMSTIASSEDNIFSPKFFISNDWKEKSYADVLLNAAGDTGRLFPLLKQNELIKQSIDANVKILTNMFSGNSLNFAKGTFGNNFKKFDSSLGNFDQLSRNGIRQQYKKLATIWNLYPDLNPPQSFTSPFNSGIARMLMNNEILISSSNEFQYSNQEFEISYDIALSAFISKTLATLKLSKTAELVAWINEQKNRANEVGANEDWFVAYRIDQHIYHLGRLDTPSNWKVDKSNHRLLKNSDE